LFNLSTRDFSASTGSKLRKIKWWWRRGREEVGKREKEEKLNTKEHSLKAATL
jgi:hypothetical protein